MNAPDFMPLLPPHSVEAEQSVLGGLLLENRAWERAADLINERDFYRADHRHIWRTIAAMIEAGQPADVITVAEALESHNRLDEVGGLAYLAALAQNTPSAANIRRYAEIVRERATMRALLAAADGIRAAVANADGRTPAEIAREAESTLATVAADQGAGEPVTAAAAMMEVLRHADDAAGSAGLLTGLDDLDSLTGGLEPGQLVVVAARPAVGKTALALAVARHVAQHGGRVAFFSLEMSRRELAGRLLAAAARVNGRNLKTGLSADEWGRLTAASTAPGFDSLILDDTPAASVAYIRARARRLNRTGRLSLIAVDYLQLMKPADTRATRTEQVGSLSRGLKALAKELAVPIIALAQLNRASEVRGDKRPMLSDLRDSGEVEQDADAVLLLSRAATDGDSIECQLAKHRQGPTGTFYLDFEPETMAFRKRHAPPASPKSTATSHRGFTE
ncbi:MAG: replicative DNA helicase [Pseudomonadota bacterium]|nr:replicative DNA helicase [Pseudomonadota bacterium]MDP1905662.1 replicative DNA helicase [Pseudomonadota bacterium]MDP2353332.1 replicative DNA helicase [Pseudomonadota bacterium]